MHVSDLREPLLHTCTCAAVSIHSSCGVTLSIHVELGLGSLSGITIIYMFPSTIEVTVHIEKRNL